MKVTTRTENIFVHIKHFRKPVMVQRTMLMKKGASDGI